ncbi:phosphotransferase [Halorussus limi]|uniref:Phosphotransferase n=1 Tax=Halorussus limi TaxID=2938695 RepID=A0A8U0HQR1_9EURY|nr:phosphotransferase [Halorussus limi]UPV73004.1 phosphotransferase [Halorussus limi]
MDDAEVSSAHDAESEDRADPDRDGNDEPADGDGADTDDLAAVVADADRELSAETVEAMVREIRPAWSVREATPAAEGTDVVYFVTAETPDGPRECVLKACEFLDPRAFRPEPYLMAVVGRRTSIPVPDVVGAVDDHPDLPAPFYLMERCDGEVREDEVRDLPADATERLARDAGRYLADLHALGDFEAFGTVVLARDADARGAGPTADDSALVTDAAVRVTDRAAAPTAGRTAALTTDEAATDSWRARVERTVADNLGDFHDRFADLEADLWKFIDSRLDALHGDFDPVFGDDDYRLGNLLVDPATGETRAVLDWGNASTLEPQYNLVVTEQHLSGWARHDDPLRERVRAALREGYRERSERGASSAPDDLGFGPDAERRRELYLGVTRLLPLVWFSLWYDGRTDAGREAAAEMHRRAVRELVER